MNYLLKCLNKALLSKDGLSISIIVKRLENLGCTVTVNSEKGTIEVKKVQ